MAGETDGGASLIDPSGHAQAVSQAVPLFDDTVRSLSVRTWRPPIPTEVGFSLAGEPPDCRPAGGPSTPQPQIDSNILRCWRRGLKPACATACGGQACRKAGGGEWTCGIPELGKRKMHYVGWSSGPPDKC